MGETILPWKTLNLKLNLMLEWENVKKLQLYNKLSKSNLAHRLSDNQNFTFRKSNNVSNR